MALDQSALLEVLSVLKNSEAHDRIRHAAETIYQALIEAELTAVIGGRPQRAHPGTRTQQLDDAGATRSPPIAPAAPAVAPSRTIVLSTLTPA
jgi:hypothetical protein